MSDPRYVKYLEVESDFWQLQYLGRKVNEQYSVLFDHNGYFPSDDYENHPEYYQNDIIINLKLDLEDDVVQNISYYKIKDHGLFYRGSDTRELTAHDINVIKEVLDVCTITRAPAILESLLGMPLKEGWSIKRVSKKTLSLFNGEKTIPLPTDYAKTIIDVARNVPDIRDNEDFWEINEKHLRGKYREALFALLFNFDMKHFPDVEFGATAKERIEREDYEETTEKQLISAINKGQTEQIYELIKPFHVIPRYAIEAAVQNKRAELLMNFLPDINKPDDLKYIGEYAISTGETELLKTIAKQDHESTNELVYKAYNEQRIDYVTLLLENGYILHIWPDNMTKYTSEQLLPLVDFFEVVFSPGIFEQLFQAYGVGTIKKMIDHYHCSTDIFDRKAAGYSDKERCALVGWLLEKKNIELIDYAAEKGITATISLYSEEEDLAIKCFNEGGAIWEHGKQLFSGDITYSRCLMENNMKLLHYLVKHVSVTESVLRGALEDNKDEETLRVLVQNLDLSIEEKRPLSKLSLWFYARKINDLSSFELFCERYNNYINDEERQEMYDYYVQHEGAEKVKILQRVCHLPNTTV